MRNHLVQIIFLIVFLITDADGRMAWAKDRESSHEDCLIAEDVSSYSIIYSTLKELVDERFHSNVRRQLHQVPELMFNEKQTSQILRNKLDSMNITYSIGWGVNVHKDVFDGPGGYGIVADIGTGEEPCVLLRADIDALPVMEKTSGVDSFRSQHPGKMHACGHDGHMTMLLGAAAILKRLEVSGELKGTVRIMFQPAEEGGAGGKRMREEGVLEKYPPVQHAFALHLWPTLESGVIGGKMGPVLAGADSFEMTITGVGGHAAMPHLTIDPIVASSAIILSLQSIVSRGISPLESGVCSITMVNAGEAFNVIPEQVTIRGTVRALSTDVLESLRERVINIATNVADAHGCSVNVTFWKDFYPPTINDIDLFEFSKTVVKNMTGKEVVEVEPTMGAEDFSFIAESVPSVFLLLGQGSAMHPPSNFGLHHPEFAIDEDMLPLGSRLHVELALATIDKLHIEMNHVK